MVGNADRVEYLARYSPVPIYLYATSIGFLGWGKELIPGHYFSLELGLLTKKFRTISGHLCEKLANVDSYLARFVNIWYDVSGR